MDVVWLAERESTVAANPPAPSLLADPTRVRLGTPPGAVGCPSQPRQKTSLCGGVQAGDRCSKDNRGRWEIYLCRLGAGSTPNRAVAEVAWGGVRVGGLAGPDNSGLMQR